VRWKSSTATSSPQHPAIGQHEHDQLHRHRHQRRRKHEQTGRRQTDDTTRSITRNGKYTIKPIMNAVVSSLSRNAGATTVKGKSSATAGAGSDPAGAGGNGVLFEYTEVFFMLVLDDLADHPRLDRPRASRPRRLLIELLGLIRRSPRDRRAHPPDASPGPSARTPARSKLDCRAPEDCPGLAAAEQDDIDPHERRHHQQRHRRQ